MSYASAAATPKVERRRRPMRSGSTFGIGNVRNPREGQDRQVVWRSDSVVNPHVIAIGASGVGKTHRMRSIISQLCTTPDIRIHAVDVHDDLNLQGASSVEFTETGNVGLNPLQVSSDRDFGGPRKKIRAFIAMLNRTSWNLGPKQEAVLVNLLQDLYQANGFMFDDWSTWDLNVDKRAKRPYPRRQPALSDLRRFAEFKLKQRLYGIGSDAVRALEQINQAYRKLERVHTQNMRDRNNEKDLEPLKTDCFDYFKQYLNTIENGREITDLLRYDSHDVIKSVTDRIITLESIGIFKDQKPAFDPEAPIWRYRVHTLSADEQRVFVDVLIEDLFFEAKRRGPCAHPHTVIVLDEAHKFLTQDDDHILNIGMREARKFGISFILASQSLTEFPEMCLANAATKIILGVDSTVQDATARRLKINSKALGNIVPKRTALVQIRQGGDLSNEFHDVALI